MVERAIIHVFTYAMDVVNVVRNVVNVVKKFRRWGHYLYGALKYSRHFDDISDFSVPFHLVILY